MILLWNVAINDWVNNREAGDLRRYRAHYDAIVMHSVSLLYVLSCVTSRRKTIVQYEIYETGITHHAQVVRTLDTNVGGGKCLWDSETRVRNWDPSLEAIRSWLEFPLPSLNGDMSSHLLQTKWYQWYIYASASLHQCLRYDVLLDIGMRADFLLSPS